MKILVWTSLFFTVIVGDAVVFGYIFCQDVCGGEIKVETGVRLKSPNYPKYYQPNQRCVWKVTVPYNYQIALKFHSFDVENHDHCSFDYVEVRDGLDRDSPLMGVFCGNDIPPNLRSTSNHLLVKFVSDGQVQRPGFFATFIKEFDECSGIDHDCAQICMKTLTSYKCACRIGYELHSDGKNCEVACGGILQEPYGIITSPSFPHLYPPNKNCVWQINAPPQYSIMLSFTHFDLEGNDTPQQPCQFDNIKIHSIVEYWNLTEHGIFCGSKLPPPIMSDGNTLRINFKSDLNTQKTGFVAVFRTDKNECATNNGGCQHECINTIGSYMCTCQDGFTLHENQRNCKFGCRYEISSPHGQISSPNYNPNRKVCAWHFTTKPGHRIQIHFLSFEISENEPHQNCSFDHVVLYDGDSSEAETLGRFCGSKIPPRIVASGSQMLMVFKWNAAAVKKDGFRAVHSTACGGHLQATFGPQYFYSHSKFGRSVYDHGSYCEWRIEAQPWFYTRLMFDTFDVEKEKDCGYDYVEVFSGFDSSGVSLGKFCGHSKPAPIISTNEALFVIFKTDDTMAYKGFSIVYEAVEPYDTEEEYLT